MRQVLWIALCLGIGACSRPQPRPDVQPEAAPSASSTAAPPLAAQAPAPRASPLTPGAAVEALSTDLHRTWRRDPTRRRSSMVMSPLSIAGALALLHAGARGATQEEIARALYLSAQVKAEALLGLESKVTPSFELTRAQRVFVDRRVELEPSFTQATKHAFAPISFLDPEAARTEINRWVATGTKKRIPTLLPPGSLTEGTRLVVVDALAASMRWATAFDPQKTRPAPFTNLDGVVEMVPMMFGVSVQRHASSETYEAVDFACADRDYALLMVAPKRGHFDAVDAALSETGIEAVLASLSSGELTLGMPRFRAVLPPTSLREQLRALGIRSAFDDANLTGITTTKKLVVDDAFHAAMIDVDENGARVAAATGIVVRLPAPLAAITIDRPFLFWLRNVRTGTPIVMGRYMGSVGA